MEIKRINYHNIEIGIKICKSESIDNNGISLNNKKCTKKRWSDYK